MRKMIRSAIWLGLCAALASCSGSGEAITVTPPGVVFRLTLPAELPPAAAECLDLVLSAPTGEPPPTALGFGANPLFIVVETVDVNGDGRRDTAIRFLRGSLPFPVSGSTEIRITAARGASAEATFAVEATVRRADGTQLPEDPCSGGTALARGSAQLDTAGRPIRFPTKGDTLVDLPLACVRAGGCAIAPPDGGAIAPPDGGAADGG